MNFHLFFLRTKYFSLNVIFTLLQKLVIFWSNLTLIFAGPLLIVAKWRPLYFFILSLAFSTTRRNLQNPRALKLWSWLFDFFDSTPARTLSISGLKSQVLKLPFINLKMMVKTGLDFFFWNPSSPFRYLLTCQANSSFLGRFFVLSSSNSEGARLISKLKKKLWTTF